MGVYPDFFHTDARERRDQARKLVAQGVDPSENRKVQKVAKEERSANGLEVVERERFA